jgi:epoxyqueuosine reductase
MIAGEPIITRCLDLGFAAAGIAHADHSAHAAELRDWLTTGKHGSMAYLADHVETRLDPRGLLPGAQSIILVAALYQSRNDPRPAALPPLHGRLARYAQGRDYHRILKRRLHALADSLREEHPAHAFKPFADILPILEREHAARASLGWIGKHTLLIHPTLGSYTLLGGVLTTLAVAPPKTQQPVTDHCGTCTRCIDACPTSAITPYSVDASRCISYLTIERRLPVPAEFHAPIGDWLFGCDICQDVCPHNSPRPAGLNLGHSDPALAPRHTSLNALDMLAWSAEDRATHLHGTPLARMTLATLKRNAIIVLTNLALQDNAHRPLVAERLLSLAADDDEPELVRHTARDSLARLGL